MKKILVIGEAYQGKSEWARKNYPDYTVCSAEMLKQIYSGKKYERVVIPAYHRLMKSMLESSCDYKAFTRFVTEMPSWVVVSNEIGCGIVPLKKSDRIWREETGRMLTLIASAADEVYRVFCGIPTRIK